MQYPVLRSNYCLKQPFFVVPITLAFHVSIEAEAMGVLL
jgi:hypothetical protein